MKLDAWIIILVELLIDNNFKRLCGLYIIMFVLDNNIAVVTN